MAGSSGEIPLGNYTVLKNWGWHHEDMHIAYVSVTLVGSVIIDNQSILI